MARKKRRTYPDLKTYFKESGERQVDFAQRLNRSQAWVSRVKDRRVEPSLEEALKISRLAGVPLESLIAAERIDSLA